MTKFDEFGLPEPTKYPQMPKVIKMKERIKKLAEQAGGNPNYKAFRGYFLPPPPDYIDPATVDLEKFAELIVRECVAQCEQVATDADAMTKSKFVTDAGRQLHEGIWGGAKNCAAGIKQHFGVE